MFIVADLVSLRYPIRLLTCFSKFFEMVAKIEI